MAIGDLCGGIKSSTENELRAQGEVSDGEILNLKPGDWPRM